jgi:para-aminobenzoate synthetase / 4-amino-4-deoxychorismate lyase
MLENDPYALIHCARRKAWLSFRHPIELISTARSDELPACLRRVSRLCEQDGLYAVGFLSYEAAAGLDHRLRTQKSSDLPLLCFGLFREFESMKELPPVPQEGYDDQLAWRPSIESADYRQAIAAIKKLIASGDTYQVNYSYRLRSAECHNAYRFFRQIQQAQRGRYGAYLDIGRWALCSASPELFFSLDGDRIISRPMKGTAPRGRSAAEDREAARALAASTKNRAENIMITDMVRNDIGRIAEPSSLSVPEICVLEKYPTLWQLASQVEGITQAGLDEIFAALFPAASITGAPKRRTMEIIAELEDSPRGIYTGSIGFIEPGRRAQFNVAIRTAVLDRHSGTVEYGVGGGIVWDSIDQAEFDETSTKALVLSAQPPEFKILETILWQRAAGYYLLDRHLERMETSADYFMFAFDRARLLECLAQHRFETEGDAQRLRVLLDRDGGIEIESRPLQPLCPSGRPRITLAQEPIDPADPFLYHKTTNRTIYEQRRIAGLDDVLLWNERGELCESTIANLLLEIDGELLTPPVASGLLAGTQRAELLGQGQCREKVLRIEDLDKADEIYLMNSVRGVYEVELVKQ